MPSRPGQAVIICVWLDAFCVKGNNKNDYYGKDGVNKLRKQPGHYGRHASLLFSSPINVRNIQLPTISV